MLELYPPLKASTGRCKSNPYTPEPRYSKRARQNPFVYYIKSFTISRHRKKMKILLYTLSIY